jgi:hypothetical protein
VEYSDDAAGFVFCAVIFHASSFSYQNDFMMAEGRFSESGKRGSDTAGGSEEHSIHAHIARHFAFRDAAAFDRRNFYACAEGILGHAS